MKSFLKHNLSLLFNIGLLVLLFTYPISNINGAKEQRDNNKVKESLETNNIIIERGNNINLKRNNFIIHPIYTTQSPFEVINILYTKK
jgi:hypothetical protein